jgi:hypothetical protein
MASSQYVLPKHCHRAQARLEDTGYHCCTTSYPSFVSPSAILKPAHTQSIKAAPFAIPKTSVDA